jgi:hypothetical protein
MSYFCIPKVMPYVFLPIYNMRLIIIMSFLLIVEIAHAQSGRIFGARAFQVDDGSGSGKTLTWDVASPLSSSYQLHFPNVAPHDPFNYLVSDSTGMLTWADNILPPLAAGNLWRGSSLGVAEAMPPGPVGSMLAVDGSSMPGWTLIIPPQVTISANQITSGTLPPGTVVLVGDGATIQPGGSGMIVANKLTGAGVNKYSGSVDIPQNALSIAINYSGTTASSVIMATIIDQSGQTNQVSVGQITPGIGFTIFFAGYYPGTTGKINYLVIN